jgi:CRISPR/Cas system CSM-associated protein Csm5 (group 7 of RAMP superfamily)
MENYNIKIDEGKYKYGYLRGRVDNFYWYALVHKEQLEYGINPDSLQSGQGRVTRLCIYKEVIEHGGNPYVPTSSIKRYIYANYKKEWEVFNGNYIEMIRQLINYLERRYSLKLIK